MSHSRGRLIVKWPMISCRRPGPMAWVGRTTRRPSTVIPTRARRTWAVMLCTSVRTSTCAGHPAQSWRGSAWARTMSRLPTGRTETSRWMPPKFHHMPLPWPLKRAGRQWVRSERARREDTRTVSWLVPRRNPVSVASNGT